MKDPFPWVRALTAGWLAVFLTASSGPGPAFAVSPPELRNIQVTVNFKSAGYSHENRLPYETLRQGSETQMLVVADGMEASIFLGKKVPYVTWYRNYLIEEGYVDELAVELVSVGTSLKVSPRIIGNRIEITLTPEISVETRDGTRSIAVTRMSTTVSAVNGSSVEIGRLARKDEFSDRFYQRENGEAVMISLTPQILDW